MLWTAIATAMRMPRAFPSPNATPTPMPSEKEWAVMIADDEERRWRRSPTHRANVDG